tara:strand:- start:601 stop:1083 length:483 start_codon:yes stop_codon:yes gene_type:complete
MEKLQKHTDEVWYLQNFLSEEECDKYFSILPKIGPKDGFVDWDLRTKDISNDPIVAKTKKYLNNFFKKNLSLDQAQLQNHNVNSSCELHTHGSLGRENTEYNSLIYLNDDFHGGCFITKHGIKIKPQKGMLTFFNGATVTHGVEKVLLKDRKTIIFWWEK